MDQPQFPRFKPIALEDRPFLHDLIWRSQPETSELTFTNLFVWRAHYGIQWSVYKDWVLLIAVAPGGETTAFPPLGPAPRLEPVRVILDWLEGDGHGCEPRLERADARLLAELGSGGEFAAGPDRDQFDYVYPTADLIALEGSRYHGKRNHIARFTEAHAYAYARLEEAHVIPCLGLAEAWCTVKRCDEDMDLMDEWDAVRECLANFRRLEVRGGVVLVEGKVEAFTLGELLNATTAVVHFEKANPDIPGLYAVINREFCRNEWSSVPFVNREQDLGEPGLRKAKLSYHPVRLAEKFAIRKATGGGGSR
jgi:hypothetical protein